MRLAAYALELVGLAGLFYGLWLVYPPAAYIVAGLVVIVAAQGLEGKP